MTGQFWMNITEKERGQYPKVKLAYIPIPCQHCEEAPCVKAAENGAVYRRDDGIIIINPERAAGQKQIVASCPYGAIYWNEEKDIPQKCTLCAHLLDSGWKEPRCVEMCPTGALAFGDFDNPESEVSRLLSAGNTESLNPKSTFREKVVYTNLPKIFIGGTVILGDRDECARGASIFLVSNDIIMTTETDIFGDFEFEKLEKNMDYVIKIEAEGYEPQEKKVKTKTDIYIGIIWLKKV
jgi:Fe-S-cluster-containing dehydrogenase component